MQVFAKGGVDVRAEAGGGIEAFLFLDDIIESLLAPPLARSSRAVLLVGVPLLLLRVTDPHYYYHQHQLQPIPRL